MFVGIGFMASDGRATDKAGPRRAATAGPAPTRRASRRRCAGRTSATAALQQALLHSWRACSQSDSPSCQCCGRSPARGADHGKWRYSAPGAKHPQWSLGAVASGATADHNQHRQQRDGTRNWTLIALSRSRFVAAEPRRVAIFAESVSASSSTRARRLRK